MSDHNTIFDPLGFRAGASDPEKFPATIRERRQRLRDYVNVTCKKSAELKGIDPWEELKSIIFERDDGGYVIAHIPGDSRVDERRLAALVDEETLTKIPAKDLWIYGLEKGRINPFTAKLYLGMGNTIHVVCVRVFENQFVHTNNDNVGGWLKLRPQEILHWVDNVMVAREGISIPRKRRMSGH